jgi:hypothetical protein
MLRTAKAGFSFLNQPGTGFVLAIPHLLRQLVEQGFGVFNWPSRAALPGPKVVDRSKGLATYPREWIKAVNEQIENQDFPLSFQRAKNLKGKYLSFH